jgi:hypothetical protein
MPIQTTKQSVIAYEEFEKLTRPVLGLPVSWVWQGYGSAIFLEIGKLTLKKNRKDGTERISYTGEYGVMIEWSWRVERSRSIYFGSWSTDKVIENRLAKLKDRTLEGIEVEGRLPELVIRLSGGLWVHSFATAESQPRWCLFLDRKRSPVEWLVSERGKLIKETQSRWVTKLRLGS